MSRSGFRVLDSDLHVIEPRDLYERYLDPRYKARAPRPLDARQIGTLCEQHKVTIMMSTPTFLRTYLKRCEPQQLKSLDLVICDVQLPKIDGREVAKEFKRDATLQKIPIIAVTAYAMVGDREAALAAGCSECLTKPYEIDELVALVERYLGAAGSRAA